MSKSTIERLIEQERWGDARKAILQELAKRPASHWLLIRLATTFYEQRDYATALEVAARAYSIAPLCPLVLWDLAGILDALGAKADAIDIYHELLSRSVSSIANDECGEGEEWARSLLADCHYRLAACYEDIAEWSHAKSHYENYLKQVANGAKSIYPLKEADEAIRRIGLRMSDPGSGISSRFPEIPPVPSGVVYSSGDLPRPARLVKNLSVQSGFEPVPDYASGRPQYSELSVRPRELVGT